MLHHLKTAAKNALLTQYHGRKTIELKNREGLTAYNCSLLPQRMHAPGVSAMLRIKNEASKIELCLRSIASSFDEIVVVNNGSSDDTGAIVERLAKSPGMQHVKLFDYPHVISRCGADNSETPEDSVHSLAYYYNWSLSQCSRAWVFKWDGDMVLPARSRQPLQSILTQAKRSGPILWNIRGQTVYIDQLGQAWASHEEINHEVMLFPNSPAFHYKKGTLWEVLTTPFTVHEEYPSEVIFHEVKDTREDEFGHWTDTSNFSPRKKIEYQNFHHVRSSEPPEAARFSRTNIT